MSGTGENFGGEYVNEPYIEPWELLTAEQQLFADTLKEALTGKFERYGASAEDFRVVSLEDPFGKDWFYMVYAGLSGIDIGDPSKPYDYRRSYDTIASEASDDIFILEIGGELVDARRVMTGAVYEAFINDQKRRGANPLPDSEHQDQSDIVHTTTWLTGEEPALKEVKVGIVNSGGNPEVRLMRRHHDGKERLVRPGVVIPESKSERWFVPSRGLR